MDHTAPPVAVELSYDRRLSYALQQNAVPLVKRIELRNASEAPLAGLELSLACEPAVFARRVLSAGELAPGATLRIEHPDLALDAPRLVRQTEREAGTLRLEVLQGENVLVALERPLEILAYDEWSGGASLPEILAAFVLPNHPAVERILLAASHHLERTTGRGALDGYQSRDPARARAIAAAVLAALGDLELGYVNPPASFEREGQKVRTPDRIVEARLATCLDLSLLAAACLEQAGLHPFVVLLEGHACAGAWLTDEHFHEPAQAEPMRLAKRADLDLLLVFETTGVTERPLPSFQEACAKGRALLDDPARFSYAVDVAAARAARILPLPLRASAESFSVVAPKAGAQPAPAPPAPPPAPSFPATQTEPRTRLERWKRKLLDLSLRNRLINYRETKKTIPLLATAVGELEDSLAGGREFRLLPEPDLMGATDPRDPELFEQRTGEDARAAFLAGEMHAGRLHAALDEAELDKRLVQTYRAARLSLEEGGANTLYLALGFLRWFETPSSTQERRAPIVLVPLALERKNLREGFRLRLLDEEPRVNVTLLQKLESDFELRVPGLEGYLPRDEAGLDVDGIFREVRRAVLPFDRWDVVEEASLGLFSFTKFLMWLDLEERSKELKRNAVVRHLVERPEEAFEPEASFPDERELDRLLDPAATFTPLDADSSQLAAIEAAAEGRTFVLQGPPGTGKSQTIANLIAHCLATGKRVLFVSEKMAALDVVHRRLARAGLEPFVLALHSNKSSKRETLDQLRAALDAPRGDGAPGWEQRTKRLAELRRGLNDYCARLHGPRPPLGTSAFEAFARGIGLRDVMELALDPEEPDAVDAARLDAMRDAVEVLEEEARAGGGVAGHPLLPVMLERWRPGLDARSAHACRALGEAVAGLLDDSARIAQASGIDAALPSLKDALRLGSWAALFAGAPAVPAELAFAPGWEETRARLEEAVRTGRERDALRGALFQRYRPALLDLHLPDLERRLASSLSGFALFRWFKARPARKALKSVLVPGSRLPGNRELIDELGRARRLREASNVLARPGHEAARLLGPLWNGGEADWEEVERAVDWAGRVRALLAECAGGDTGRLAALRERWRDVLAAGAGFAAPLDEAFRAARERFDTCRTAWGELLEADHARVFGARPLAEAKDAVAAIADRAGALRGWCGYRQATRRARALDLGPLVDALEDGRVAPESLPAVFERSFFAWFVRHHVEPDPALGGFSHTRHELAIRRFRGLDKAVREMTADEVRGRLAARLPRRDAAEKSRSDSSEMGLLFRELSKKRRHLPLRQLFSRIPNALARLKPCMLMSPLSVAQYLAPDAAPFDLVVFDEASQIPVWDAVGAIARGERLVVVGDTKQLPPTTFFMREESDEPLDAEEIEDLESVLDECVAARLPTRELKWHYRSRHESLIAFSNHHYYAGRLWTFPGARGNPQRLGVSLRRVPDGVYDKGRSRTNRVEAEALLAELARRLEDPDESKRSIGVVTFSIPQQSLLEDRLEVLRRQRPALDRFFTDEVEEPVFVKNLENVQGDERDVILFSVCYGPDEQGKVSMNFGPLNRAGGERRLNVAITRAREQVVVFSSLEPERIDLARTRAVGVAHLKTYLDFAVRGAAAIGGGTDGSPHEEVELAFTGSVARALEKDGWTVHRRVGCSAYRIDLAVVHPEDKQRYLLGIEGDGPTYAAAPTARDRDRTRAAVLRSLGWRLHRIWIPDFHYEPEREIARLRAALDAALREDSPAAPSEEPEAVGPGGDDDDVNTPQRTYRLYAPAAPYGTAEDFYEPRRLRGAIRSVRETIRREAPIVFELACRRVASLWQTRSTDRLRERVQDLIPQAGGVLVRDEHEEVVWARDQSPKEYARFRVPRDDAEPDRESDEIPAVEIANAAAYLLASHLSIARSDLARETARLFGFKRLGPHVQRHMERGIALLAKRGGCVVDGETVALPT